MSGEYDVMQSPDFGALGGLKTLEVSRQAGLHALETMGKIISQPINDDLHKAHTEYYRAEAQAKLQAAAQEAAAGKDLQAAYVAQGGNPEDVDQDQLLNSVTQAAARRGDVKTFTKGVTQQQAIALKRAQTDSANARAGYDAMRAAHGTIKDLGAAAGSVNDQTSYDMMRQGLLSSPNPELQKAASDLPMDFGSAKPYLESFKQSSIDSADKLRLAATKLRDKQLQEKRLVDADLARARTEVLGVRSKLLKNDLDARIKNGGKDSPQVTELRQEQIEAAKARRRAAEVQRIKTLEAMYPPLTELEIKDPTKIKLGSTRMIRGQPYRFTGIKGQEWIPVQIGEPQKTSGSDESDDDEEEE